MQISVSSSLPVPAAAAWHLIGTRFGDIGTWASPITSSSLDADRPGAGAVRTCHIKGFGPVGPGVILERLLEFDDAAMTFSYEGADGLPPFIKAARNRWSVTADSADRCTVTQQADAQLAWWLRPMTPLIAWRMRRDGAAMLDELGHMLQTGRPHPRKAAS